MNEIYLFPPWTTVRESIPLKMDSLSGPCLPTKTHLFHLCRCANMRGGAQSGGDPLGMAGSDYAELCELAPSRWSSRSGGVAYHQVPQQQQLQQQQQHQHHHYQQREQHPQQQQTQHHHPSGGGHVRSNSSSFEAEDVGVGPYGVNSRIANRSAISSLPLHEYH